MYVLRNYITEKTEISILKNALAYTPAITSSVITPQPRGSFSARRIGGGLIISKILNRKNPSHTVFKVKGIKSIVTRMPAISSMVILPGSCPQKTSQNPDDHTPIKYINMDIEKSPRFMEMGRGIHPDTGKIILFHMK